MTKVVTMQPELLATTWMAQAQCKDVNPDYFFPEDGYGVLLAQKICFDCPVRLECLEYALKNNMDHGVWGGTSERERRRIRRKRRNYASAQK
jgi:WhiB family redox-sensing transcriptional regulator